MQAPIPIANTVGYGIDQPDLKRAGLAGGDEARDPRRAAALAITAHGDANTGDDEAAAGPELEYSACQPAPPIFP
ncbi:hypothetical protein BRDID11002_77100 [Bradyrhizobium diazoefficiens]